MKINPMICFIQLVVLVLSSSAFAASNDHLEQSQLHLIGGKTESLEQFRNSKPLYMKFWASWCGPCLKEMPHFEHVQTEYGDDIAVIGINLGINDTLDSANGVIERFGLTMPTAIDKTGELAKAFKFVGTPYHLLFDKNFNLVHRGHEANEVLDNRLKALANKHAPEALSSTVFEDDIAALDLPDTTQPLALFFTATWCDWYLVDENPEAATDCAQSQKAYNRLLKDRPDIQGIVISSALWTGDAEVEAYRKKYAIEADMLLDKSNKTFLAYQVKHFPTVVIIKNGSTVFRAERNTGHGSVVQQLGKWHQ